MGRMEATRKTDMSESWHQMRTRERERGFCLCSCWWLNKTKGMTMGIRGLASQKNDLCWKGFQSRPSPFSTTSKVPFHQLRASADRWLWWRRSDPDYQSNITGLFYCPSLTTLRPPRRPQTLDQLRNHPTNIRYVACGAQPSFWVHRWCFRSSGCPKLPLTPRMCWGSVFNQSVAWGNAAVSLELRDFDRFLCRCVFTWCVYWHF
jgi:hypothetical protein